MRARPAVADTPAFTPRWMLDAAVAGGAELVPLAEADSLVWGGAADPAGLREVLAEHGAHLEWVQLPWAGVEPYLGLLDHGRTWTCAKGAYGDDVAEMALALLLAGTRGLVHYARSSSWRQAGELGTGLHGEEVCVVGGGGIATHLCRLLQPFGCRVTVVRRRPDPVPGAHRVLGADRLDEALPDALAVVLALPLTADTEGLIDRRRLAAMRADAWLVNVARGGHVVTDDLVEALRSGSIGGAALDVTDPEPLPEGHPLWGTANCLITPHVANTSEMLRPRLAARIRDNVERRAAGLELLGVVDVEAGY
jgi:phosphoglycerate dehydrogenase-like enzyme